jgi:hypothetical protein
MFDGKNFSAAVLKYVGGKFDEAPPGHRFRLYFEYWDNKWNPPREAKLEVLEGVTSYPKSAWS